ncbi:hypothetical protein F2P79_016894 [Pimephales promelas]|nr:hypothetical protein F2P79_016894 [Pimephales promelas]KAG1940177.1 hypothetical protein F2P79_016894 [Pimephales promelas]
MTTLEKLLFVFFILELLRPCQTKGNSLALSYTRLELLALRAAGDHPPPNLIEDIRSSDPGRRTRRRGKRGGIRQHLRRRGNRPPLPSMILSNVRSLKRKMDELRINASACYEYRESSIMVFTETWLRPDVPDSLCEVEGFSFIRSDRSETSGKERGGGICVFINDKWCRQYTVRKIVCNPDVELMCLSLRPLYLPREFGNIILCSVYVPPSGNAANAAAHITDCVHQQLLRTPEAAVVILGDFNHCNLELSLPGFSQYVKCGTREDRILDKCYCNVKNAYVSRAKPPLSNSDHNVVHLIPTYRTVLKSCKPHTKTVKVWTSDSIVP